MPIKEHLENTLRINPEPTPFFKMLLSGVTITTPLLFGYLNNQVFVSMFGSLMALVFFLNDHFDPFHVRIKHLSVTFVLLMITLVLGALSYGHNTIILIALFVLSFLVGKSKNYGIKLERLMLFITLQYLTTSSESIIKLKLNPLLYYSLIAFVNYLFWCYAVWFITKHAISPHVSKRETIKKIINENRSDRFPLVCAVFCSVGFLTAQFFHFSHANWIVGTALIVMLPDSYQSIYKSAQRLIGTIGGVLLATFIMTYIHDPRALIAFVFICAFLMPHGLIKNYWVANIYIAALILFFLEIASPLSLTQHNLAFWRIVDIAVGSFIGVLAAIWRNPRILFNETKTIKY